MDSKTAYCIGLYQGDGGIGRNVNTRMTSNGKTIHEYWYIHFGSTDEYLTEEFNEGFNLGKQIIVSHDNRKESYKDYYRVSCHNKEAVDYLKSLGYGERKSLDLSVLREQIKGYEWEFLQGFMETDGYVTDRINGNYVEWCSVDREVSDYVKEIIWGAGIICRQYQDCKRRKQTMYAVRVPQSEMPKLYNKLFEYKPKFVSRKHKRFLKIIEEN